MPVPRQRITEGWMRDGERIVRRRLIRNPLSWILYDPNTEGEVSRGRGNYGGPGVLYPSPLMCAAAELDTARGRVEAAASKLTELYNELHELRGILARAGISETDCARETALQEDHQDAEHEDWMRRRA